MIGYFALPYYTKFLLIAAFLASYNPPRYDVRYFAKAGEARKRKKGGGTRKAKVDNLGGKVCKLTCDWLYGQWYQWLGIDATSASWSQSFSC